MATPTKSANAKFYIKQAQEFRLLDRECDTMHGTHEELDRLVGLECNKPVGEERSAYGLSRGSRAVLIDCRCWERKVWFIFLQEGGK